MIWCCSPAKGCAGCTGLRNGSNSNWSFLDGLRAARKVTRGPKPERALRELGLKSDLRAEEPTTDGLIATLSSIDLRGRRVGVQLYPGNPNTRFTDFLRQAGAEPDPVLPYIYASAADDEKVVELIDRMAGWGRRCHCLHQLAAGATAL